MVSKYQQYSAMRVLHAALPMPLTEGVYDDEAHFCHRVALTHPNAVRANVRVPGTDETDCWLENGAPVAIWNGHAKVGALSVTHQLKKSPRPASASALAMA